MPVTTVSLDQLLKQNNVNLLSVNLLLSKSSVDLSVSIELNDVPEASLSLRGFITVGTGKIWSCHCSDRYF